MSVQRIAARYAKSLIDLAVERGVLEGVVRDMEHFRAVAGIREMLLLLRSPIVHASTKRSVFNRLFGEAYNEMTLKFLDIVLRKGRESMLPEIGDEFVAQYRVLKGISLVKLTTATALSEESLAEIRQKISIASLTRDNVQLETHVDSTLLGGFVLEFDDRQYDVSVASKLDEMRRTFSH